MLRSPVLGVVVVLACGCGATIDYRGYAAADARAFVFPPALSEQKAGNAVSLAAEPEVYLQSVNERHLLTVRPFLRLDPIDRQRSHWDIRRADYVATFTSFELGVGAGIFHWGVLESYGLTDVINQADYVEDLDRSQKLGQPYLSLGWLPGSWAVRFYALPFFRKPTFPGPSGRLRFGAVVDPDDAIFEAALGEWHPGFAMRISGTAGDLDLGLGLFSGTSREPRFVAKLTEPGVVAAYDLSHQASLDVSWALGPVALKAEGMARLWSEELRFFWAGGAGLDWTAFDIAGTGIDLTLAAEFLYDARPDDAPVTFFEHDVFFGFRLAFNDTDGTAVLGGTITDVTDGRSYVRLAVQRRFGDHWQAFLELHSFLGARGALESTLLADHHGEAHLAYFF